MKIINKLTLGYLIVSLFFMIVAIVGVVTINNINVAYDELSKENIPVVEALENVKAMGLKMGLSSSEIVLIRSESETNDDTSLNEKEDVKLAIKEFDAAISRYEELINKFYPEERVTVETIKKSSKKFQNTSNEIIALKEQGASGKVVLEKWKEFEEAEEEFLKLINDAIAYEHDEFAARDQNVEDEIAISVKIILMLALFTFSIAIVLGVIISKSISDPITRLKNATEDISKGKMDTRVDIKSSDELGILAAGFNQMAATLEHDIVERKYADDALRQSYETQSVINSLLNLVLEDKTLDDILKGALDRIFSIPWLAIESKGSIFLIEDEPDVLVMKAQIGLSEIIREKCARVPFGRCLCGRAAQMHEIQFAAHLDDRHDIVYDGIKPHGHYCVPILSLGRTLGVLNFYLKEGHRREQQEETFLIAVADTLAGIIQRKRSEFALKESEERHRSIVDFSPDGIAIHSEGKIVYLNAAGANILGSASPDQFIGKNVFDIIHPDYHNTVGERIRMQEIGKVALPIEEVFVRSDGTFVDVEISSIPLRYMGKQAMYGVFRDITERKRKEEMLHEGQERFRKIFDDGPFGMAIASLEYRFIRINKKLCQMLGYTELELNRLAFIDITHPEDVDNDIRSVQRLKKGDVPYFKIDKRYIKKNGDSLWINLTVSIIRDSEGKPLYYLAFIEDITENKIWEEMRLKNIRLEEADKVKSEFIASMSHELRTPLNSSIGFSELLKMGSAGELNEKQGRYVDNILASNQFLLTLINDILDLSKVEAGKIELMIEKMSVPMTVKETLSLIKEKASKNNVHLNTEFDPELEFIDADKQRFKQVLFNLLSNAVKFTPKDGTVTIKTKIEGNMAQISVSDTGIGIREENIGKLFQKFEQLDPGISKQYGGTGLGLAITKQLVELHGGAITALSRYGEGSMFTFTLPIEAKKGLINEDNL